MESASKSLYDSMLGQYSAIRGQENRLADSQQLRPRIATDSWTCRRSPGRKHGGLRVLAEQFSLCSSAAALASGHARLPRDSSSNPEQQPCLG